MKNAGERWSEQFGGIYFKDNIEIQLNAIDIRTDKSSYSSGSGGINNNRGRM